MAKLLTTVQVRDIMRANGGRAEYTNKTAGHTGNVRRVKAYYRGNKAMVAALRKACGAENVRVTGGDTSGGRSYGWAGVTVKCVLA